MPKVWKTKLNPIKSISLIISDISINGSDTNKNLINMTIIVTSCSHNVLLDVTKILNKRIINDVNLNFIFSFIQIWIYQHWKALVNLLLIVSFFLRFLLLLILYLNSDDKWLPWNYKGFSNRFRILWIFKMIFLLLQIECKSWHWVTW